MITVALSPLGSMLAPPLSARPGEQSVAARQARALMTQLEKLIDQVILPSQNISVFRFGESQIYLL